MLLNFADRLRLGLARYGAPLDFHGRLRRVGAEAGASAYHRRVERGRAYKGVGRPRA